MTRFDHQPFTPDEFDAAQRELLRRYPRLKLTSGYRPYDPGCHGDDMARDYKDYDDAYDPVEVVRFAHNNLGLWGLHHDDDDGDGKHFHFQGKAPEDPFPDWWRVKYSHRLV